MIIVANWKAYVEDPKAAKKLSALAKRLAGQTKVKIILAPSAPQLGLLAHTNRSKVQFAAQNISEITGGAATGEVTAQIVAGMGAEYVIIGHSERRSRGETDGLISAKVQHALAQGLTPIVCVGESERDPEAKYLSFVRAQIAAVFEPLSQKERMQIIVAYEPVWAIGKTAAESIMPNDLTEMVLYIRKVLSDYLPHKGPAHIPVLYGGSAEPENARSLAGGSGIDGFIVGHACVDPVMFAALVKAVS
jgi:triosephosphate isomerase